MNSFGYRNSNEIIEKRRCGVIHTLKFSKSNASISSRKSLSVENYIKDAVQNNELLRKFLYRSRLNMFIDQLYMKKVAANETIFTRGEKGRHLYITITGRYKILFKEGPKKNQTIEFDDKRIIGELAIIHDSNRTETVIALTEGTIWALDCNVFQENIIYYNKENHEKTLRLLREMELPKNLFNSNPQKYANIFLSGSFPKGAVIYREGNRAETFFIIKSGFVKIEKNNYSQILQEGDFFGEEALTKNNVSTYNFTSTVSELGPLDCLLLSRQRYFSVVIGEDVLQNNIDNYVKLKYENLLLENLSVTSILGAGSYGRVKLVQYKDKKFALKTIKKSSQKNEDHHLENERTLQMKCNSYFIVKLFKYFSNENEECFLMEPCLGGDLWNLLHKRQKHTFPENWAKFYAACVVEGLHYLHKYNIIYRDLKPENLVIDSYGYVKITDFGFAKRLENGPTYTFVGTSEYLAPEIILSKGHGKAVDYWALGILIFEMLSGYTPFKDKNSKDNTKLYRNIINGIANVRFPSTMSKKSEKIVRELCTFDQYRRLGSRKGGIEDIISHEWFAHFQWNMLRSRKLAPPILLKVGK